MTNGELLVKSARPYGADGMPVQIKNWSRKSQATPANFLEKHLKPDQVSFWHLPKMIKNMQQMGLPVRGHLTQFWTLLFLPLTLIAMTTLGTAFFSNARTKKLFIRRKIRYRNYGLFWIVFCNECVQRTGHQRRSANDFSGRSTPADNHIICSNVDSIFRGNLT